MRQIDNMTPKEIETLALKNMTSHKTAKQDLAEWVKDQEALRTIPAEKPTAIETEQPYFERNYGRELNQLAARAERAEAHADKLAEELRSLLYATDHIEHIRPQLNKAAEALAAYEAAQ
jgi:hypothetical protein